MGGFKVFTFLFLHFLQVMINPPRPPVSPRPHITDIGLPPQVFSPETKKEPPSNYASPLLPSKVFTKIFSNLLENV